MLPGGCWRRVVAADGFWGWGKSCCQGGVSGVCVGSETLTSVVGTGTAVGFWGWGLGEELLPGGRDPHERRGHCGWLLGLGEELLPGGPHECSGHCAWLLWVGEAVARRSSKRTQCVSGSGRRPSRASWALRLAFGVGGRVVARGDPHERRERCGWLLGLREELLPGGRVGRGVCVGSETLTSVVGAAVGFWGWGLGEELLPGGVIPFRSIYHKTIVVGSGEAVLDNRSLFSILL